MNPTTFVLPLVNTPQSFNISLNNKNYIMTCRWNSAPEGGWCIGFMDQLTGAQIVDNIPLICGVDLLDGLEYLDFGGNLVVYTNGNQNAVPTIDNLGTECNVYFIVPPQADVIS